MVRRAERRLAELLDQGSIENGELLRFLNRLSSLLFILELYENVISGKGDQTLVK
jgi:cob(I)alamin adenosyltransferase